MSYEAYCNDYAVNGCPMRDHYDYEENARYDQFDGYREDADLMARQARDEYEHELYLEECIEAEDREEWEDSFSEEDCEDHAAWLDCAD